MSKLWESIRPLWEYADYIHLRWARSQMHGLHPDLPAIVLKINAYEAKGVKL